VTRNQLNALAIGLAVASVVLSILFKGLFLVLLVPAFFLWKGDGPKDEK
jgi:hypothetical protein